MGRSVDEVGFVSTTNDPFRTGKRDLKGKEHAKKNMLLATASDVAGQKKNPLHLQSSCQPFSLSSSLLFTQSQSYRNINLHSTKSHRTRNFLARKFPFISTSLVAFKQAVLNPLLHFLSALCYVLIIVKLLHGFPLIVSNGGCEDTHREGEGLREKVKRSLGGASAHEGRRRPPRPHLTPFSLCLSPPSLISRPSALEKLFGDQVEDEDVDVDAGQDGGEDVDEEKDILLSLLVPGESYYQIQYCQVRRITGIFGEWRVHLRGAS